ncbi:MAG: hypothetical protein ABTD50_08710 [Polyangiaceae bacterium]
MQDGSDESAVSTDSGGCHPGYVVAFQSSPNAYHPATAAWQGVCSSTETAAFYSDCLGSNATTSACSAFKIDASHALCIACIETPVTASHYGPLVDYGSFVAPNVAGCIELTDPNGLSCATQIQTASACELAACEVNCPVSGSADSLKAYDSCTGAADQGVCESYALAASACRRAEQDSGLSAPCLNSDFSGYYSEVVPIFCGTQSPGVDAESPDVDGFAPADGAVEDGGAAGADATMSSEAGDAREPSDAADAMASSEAGDAREPNEAGDAREPNEAGDARIPGDGGDETGAGEGEDAGTTPDASRERDAEPSSNDAGEDG